MKIRKCLWILTAAVTLTLTACALPSLDMGNGVQTTANPDEVKIGSVLTVHNSNDALTLLQNMDALSSDGLYYAAWTAGGSVPYENSDGNTVDLYDAQLYLLLGEYDSADTAQENMEDWLEAGRNNYDVTQEGTVRCGEQPYTVITYNFTDKENPYARGVSAFGVYEDCAVCIELTCQETYDEDLQEMLTGFLQDCSYEQDASRQ